MYVAYEGWIYSGRQQWSVDKLTLTDSEGQVSSFCKENGQLLPSGLPVKLTLTEGECVTASPAALAAAKAAAAAAAALRPRSRLCLSPWSSRGRQNVAAAAGFFQHSP